MPQDRRRRKWQFSLKHFLLAILVVGPVAGFLGPPVVRALLTWSPGPAPRSPAGSLPAHIEYHSESYYESGETPLD